MLSEYAKATVEPKVPRAGRAPALSPSSDVKMTSEGAEGVGVEFKGTGPPVGGVIHPNATECPGPAWSATCPSGLLT